MEAYLVTMVRQMHLSYIENYTDEENLMKNMQALLAKSHLTRVMWGERPLLQFMSLLAEKYTGPLDEMDGVLGGTVIDNYLGYYYLSDFEALEEQFGERKEDDKGNVSFDTSKVKLFDFNGLRKIRDDRLENSANPEYTKMRPDSYYDMGYKFKYDANDDIVDSANRAYTKDKEGNVRVKLASGKEGEIIIRKNGDIIKPDVAQGLLGLVKKDGKAVWFENDDFKGVFAMEKGTDGKVIIVKDKDDEGNVIKDEDGNDVYKAQTKIANKDKFSNFLNFFQKFTPDPYQKAIIQQGISEAASGSGGERLGAINEQFANLLANHLVRFTGAAARNDAPLEKHKQMYDVLARYIHFRASRAKYILDEGGDGQGKAGRYGNPETIPQFQSIAMEPMLAIVTKSWHGRRGEKGAWQKPILEAFHDLSGKRRAIRKAETDEEKEKALEDYRDTAVNTLTFDEQAERHYFDNQLERALRISSKIRGADPLDIQQFSGHSPEIGTYFKQDEFQKKMTGFMQDYRYGAKSYGAGLQYHLRARFWDYEANWSKEKNRYMGKWRTMSLAESRYGRQMLDMPEFKTKGVLDPWKIQKNQQLIYKRGISTWIEGEIVHSRKMDKLSTGERHDFAWYRNLLDALAKIPNDMEMDSDNMWDNKIISPFFTKDLMNKIKKNSHTSFGYLYGLAILKGIFIGGTPGKEDQDVLGGLGEGWGIFAKSVFSLAA
jgi:hypothetical protein